MCHHVRYPHLDVALDMFFGVRSAWWDERRNHCYNVMSGHRMATAVLRRLRRLAELERLRLHVRPEHARAVEEHRLIAEVSGRSLFARGPGNLVRLTSPWQPWWPTAMQ